MDGLPRKERERLHGEAVVEHFRGDRTKGQMDLETYFYGPEDQRSSHPPPASPDRHWLWRLVRRIAWGRWD